MHKLDTKRVVYSGSNKKILMGAACAFAISVSSAPAFAQSSGGSNSAFEDEIIVTARKKEETITDIPLSVTAFSGDQLKALGATEQGDVAAFTPNFTWNTEFGRATPQPTVRGVGSNGFMASNQQPIAVYSDHAVIGASPGQGLGLFDIDRVEVLKGPQGTLYGRNATAGLINFISVKPEIGDGTSGHAQVEVGSFGTINTEAAFESDLGENAAFRLSLATNNNNGLYENENLGGRSGTTEDLAGRLQLRLQPSDNMDVIIKGHISRATPDVTPWKAVGTICPAGVTVPNLVDCEAGAGRDNVDLFIVNTQSTREHVDVAGGSIHMNFDFNDNLSLTSVTAYDESSLERVDDVDDLAAFQEFDSFADDFTTFSQELRVSGSSESTDWHLGGFFYNEDYHGEFIADFFVGAVGNIKDFSTESYSVFGNVNHALTDRLSATAGLRFTHETKDVNYINNLTNGNLGATFFESFIGNDFFTTQLEAEVTQEETFNNLSGRFSLDYEMNDDVLLYTSFARGFKAGDLNGIALANFDVPSLTAATAITRPEILDAFEVGFKGNFAEGKLKVNGSAFYYIYKDQHQSILLPAPGVPVPVTTFTNAAKSTIPGVELDVQWIPADDWLLIGAFGWVDASYSEFIRNPTETDPALIDDFSGNKQPLTSEVEANVILAKDFPLSNGGYINIQGDARYFSEVFFQPTNELGLREDGQLVFGARAAYTSPDDKYELSVQVKNLTNEKYFVAGFNFDIPGINSLHLKPNRPRVISATAKMNF